MAQSPPKPKGSSSGDILVARASLEYRLKRYLIVLMLVGMGAWFGYDGLIGWPRENAEIKQVESEIEPARRASDNAKFVQLDAKLKTLKKHSDLDILQQLVLLYTLPPIGLVILAWSLYRSRGTYRLANDMLHAPGHPPVPLDAIRSIDKTHWDRKGIAHVNYELPNGTKGGVVLDDFIYHRQGTDDIFKRIEDYTGTGDAPQATPAQG